MTFNCDEFEVILCDNHGGYNRLIVGNTYTVSGAYLREDGDPISYIITDTDGIDCIYSPSSFTTPSKIRDNKINAIINGII